MKKFMIIVLTGLLTASVFTGCGAEPEISDSKSSSYQSQQSSTLSSYQIDSLHFQMDSSFITYPDNKQLRFSDNSNESYISISKLPYSSLEEAKRDFMSELSTSSENMSLSGLNEVNINGINGIYLEIGNHSGEGAEFGSSFLFASPSNEVFWILYASKNLTPDQVKQEIEKIVSTIQFDAS